MPLDALFGKFCRCMNSEPQGLSALIKMYLLIRAAAISPELTIHESY